MIRTIVLVSVIFSALVFAPATTSAKGRIDQSALGPTFGILSIRAMGLEQTFVPHASTLTGVKLGLYRMGQGPTNVTVTIRSGGSTGPIVGVTSRQIPDYHPGMPFDYPSDTRLENFGFESELTVTPGRVYVIQLEADSGGHGWAYPNYDSYLDGSGALRGHPGFAWDFIFQTCAADGQGKLCKEKTLILEESPKGKHDHGGCVDFDSGVACPPF